MGVNFNSNFRQQYNYYRNNNNNNQKVIDAKTNANLPRISGINSTGVKVNCDKPNK